MSIDFLDFFKKNRNYFIIGVIALFIIGGAIGGIKYYNYLKEKHASAMLGKAVRLYSSYDGKHLKTIKESISTIKKLIKNYPGTQASVISNFYSGEGYRLLQNYKKSDYYLLKYTKEYPNSSADNLSYFAYNNLAINELALKNYNAAIKYFKKQAKINNVNLQKYPLLEEASVYTELKKPQKAIAIYKSMLENDSLTNSRSYIENLIQLNSSASINHKQLEQKKIIADKKSK